MNLVEYIKSIDNVVVGKGVSEEEICSCENELNLSFSREYRLYLSAFGNAEINGSEITGITKIKRLNVVDVTKANRNINDKVENDWYVIEETNIDGIIIWQDVNGVIYEVHGLDVPKRICDSLLQYVQEYCD